MKNKIDGPVAYKIRTTDPKKFLVKPSQGFLQPEGEVEVSILNQRPGGEESSSKDRFQVLTLAVDKDLEIPENLEDNPEFYKEVWGTSKNPNQITHKLRTEMDRDQGLSSAASGLRSSILEKVED